MCVLVGGLAGPKQERVLSQHPPIVVATPGRLWKLMSEVRQGGGRGRWGGGEGGRWREGGEGGRREEGERRVGGWEKGREHEGGEGQGEREEGWVRKLYSHIIVNLHRGIPT